MRGWVGRVIYAQPNPSSYIICNFPSQEVRGWSQISGGGTPADNQSNQFHLCHRRNHIDQMEILRVARSLIPMLFLLVFLASAISSASKIYGLSLKKRERKRGVNMIKYNNDDQVGLLRWPLHPNLPTDRWPGDLSITNLHIQPTNPRGISSFFIWGRLTSYPLLLTHLLSGFNLGAVWQSLLLLERLERLEK